MKRLSAEQQVATVKYDSHKLDSLKVNDSLLNRVANVVDIASGNHGKTNAEPPRQNDNEETDEEEPPPQEDDGYEGKHIIYFDPLRGNIGVVMRYACTEASDTMFAVDENNEKWRDEPVFGY